MKISYCRSFLGGKKYNKWTHYLFIYPFETIRACLQQQILLKIGK